MAAFLANENVPRQAVELLRNSGHDVAWIREDSPGAADESVLALAVAEHRLLLTFDTDFGELAYRAGLPARCGVILFRINLDNLGLAVSKIVRAIESRADWVGHFSVVEDHRIRMRPLP